MRYRTLGETGLKVSEIGLGCWALGGDASSASEDSDAIMAIRKAVEIGCNLISTADSFGMGHSEELVGKALSKSKEKVLISTKVGHWARAIGYPLSYQTKHHVTLCCDASLERLKIDTIDLYLCHISNPDNVDAFLEGFAQLQEKGKIWYWGISTNNLAVVKQFNKNGDLAVVELEYNALNRSAEEELLPYCRKRNIGTLIKSPLANGKLTGSFSRDTTFHELDMRKKWLDENSPQFLEDIEKARELSFLTDSGRTPAQSALAFVLSNPSVNCIIPGAKQPQQAESNAQACDLPLTDEELARVQKLFPIQANI